MRRRLGLLGLLWPGVLVATTATTATASAQTTDRERAESHFEAARGLIKSGRCDLAIEELRQSIDFEPTSVGARLNLGDCYVTLGRLPEAFRQYKEAEANALQRSDARLEVARRSGADVQSRLVRVMLRESDPVVAGLIVTVDGVSAGQRPWVIAVAPDGPHELEARAPGGARWSAVVKGRAGETLRFDVAIGPTKVDSPHPPASAESGGAPPYLGFVVGAVGIVGIGVGAVFGGLAASSRGELADGVDGNHQCSGTYPNARCSSSEQARLQPIEDRAFLQSTVSTISFVGGALLLTGGVALVLHGWSSAKRGSSAARLQVGRGGALEGRF